STKTVWNHLNKAGYKKKLDVLMPHELTQKNLMDQISICESVLNRNKIDPLLKRMVTGDEMWVAYDNVKRKRSWSNPGEPAAKPGLMVRKVLLQSSTMSYGQTLNSDLYCPTIGPFEGSNRPALVNRRGIVFHQDNARPHTSLVTRHKLWELSWEVLMHPTYSPDLAPSDNYLFLSMANDFGGEKFASRKACENLPTHFFANRDEDFYERGIMKLTSKWQQVIEQN
ncbi:Transposase, partial [Caligus rogercresseyi]